MGCGCGSGACGGGGVGSWVMAAALLALAGGTLVAMLDRDDAPASGTATPVALGAKAAGEPQPATAQEPEAPAAAPKQGDVKPEAAGGYVLGFEMERIEGGVQKLEEFKGKVVLRVNVASKCGFTRQYTGLETLYKEKKDQGLVILGFPANNFGGQEPGSNEEIAKFCASNFGVTFPMFAKISVLGEDQHPLYKQLAAQPSPVGGDPKWNFTKFLVDRSGNVVARFEPSVRPDDPALTAKIDELLKAQ